MIEGVVKHARVCVCVCVCVCVRGWVRGRAGVRLVVTSLSGRLSARALFSRRTINHASWGRLSKRSNLCPLSRRDIKRASTTRVAEFFVRKPFTHRSSGGTLRPYRLACRILLVADQPASSAQDFQEDMFSDFCHKKANRSPRLLLCIVGARRGLGKSVICRPLTFTARGKKFSTLLIGQLVPEVAIYPERFWRNNKFPYGFLPNSVLLFSACCGLLGCARLVRRGLRAPPSPLPPFALRAVCYSMAVTNDMTPEGRLPRG
jgi:hypothetical protein